jgi:phosphopantothenoylcysteine decarboxylase/phosphopantothenate--cysteine ligase
MLISGPVSLPIPPGAQVMPVETAQEMLAACEGEMPADIAIFTAAVADWRVAGQAPEKLKKSGGKPPVLTLAENPDILATVSRRSPRPEIVVGFAAETERVTEHAAAKLKNKGCDLILANDVSEGSGVFGGDRNKVHLVSASGIESWPEMSKDEVARRLMERLAQMLAPQRKAAE